jgi:hypothetical protein
VRGKLRLFLDNKLDVDDADGSEVHEALGALEGENGELRDALARERALAKDLGQDVTDLLQQLQDKAVEGERLQVGPARGWGGKGGWGGWTGARARSAAGCCLPGPPLGVGRAAALPRRQPPAPPAPPCSRRQGACPPRQLRASPRAKALWQHAPTRRALQPGPQGLLQALTTPPAPPLTLRRRRLPGPGPSWTLPGCRPRPCSSSLARSWRA